MKEYGLGPNGGIMTSMNLFATRFNQVLDFVEKRAATGELKYMFVDTPGQMEVFTWSASGSIITETLASMLPTMLIYVVDTPRTTSPTTFMSNMMYACRCKPFLLISMSVCYCVNAKDDNISPTVSCISSRFQ
jgi:GTPase SAR1 family protein